MRSDPQVAAVNSIDDFWSGVDNVRPIFEARESTVARDENDRVGEYSASDPLGIRSAPYTNYPRTYGDFTGTGVHLDGEIYAAIGWRLLQIFGDAKKDTLLGYLVDGMNYTPSTPTFEHMRDGILTSVTNPQDECKVWEAFAHFGVGVGAKATVSRRGTWTIAESFLMPANCN